MGITQTKKHVVLLKHPLLGDVTPKQRYGTKQIIYRRFVPASVDLAAWEEEYHYLDLSSRDFLFLPFDYRINNSDTMCCRPGFDVDLTFELYPHILESEVSNRKVTQRFYEEVELWYLLYNVVQSCKDYEFAKEQKFRKIGDIRPKNILLNNNGNIRLITRMSWPGEFSGYDKVRSGYGEKCFLSPEEMSAAKTKGDISRMSQHKTDAFSIGMTFLNLATLKTSQDCYDYDNFRLETKLIEARKNEMSRRYSGFFCKIIDGLTDMNYQNRLSCGQVWASLNPYAEDINAVRPFKPDQQQSRESVLKYKRKHEKKA